MSLAALPPGPASTSGACRGYRTPAKARTEDKGAAWGERVVEDPHSLCDPRWSDAAVGFGKGRGV